MTRFPTLFLSHGGGPWPFMEDRRVQYARTAEEFGRLPQLLPERPKAVLVITGHWEAEKRRKETREWLRQREREIAAPSIVPEMPVRDATLTPKRG